MVAVAQAMRHRSNREVAIDIELEKLYGQAKELKKKP